jgi:hypothetical protein
MPSPSVQTLNLTMTHTGCNSSVTAKGSVQINTPTPVNPVEDSATEPESEDSMLKQLNCDQAEREKKTSHDLPIRSPQASASTSAWSNKWESCCLSLVSGFCGFFDARSNCYLYCIVTTVFYKKTIQEK